MRRFLPFLAILVIFTVASPLAARAEIREGTFELNPFAGYCTGATSRVLCHKPVYGIRAGYVITKNWEVEGAFDFMHNAAEMFQADVLYHFMPEKESFHPFVVAGLGEAHVRPRHSESYTTAMADFGVGFKYFLSKSVAIRVDYRDVITHANNAMLTAGLTFAFGGKTPEAVPPPPPPPAPAPKPEPVPQPEAAPHPAPKPEPVAPAPAPEPEPVKIVLEDVHFANNRAALTDAAKEILDKNIAVLKENPEILIEIQGHTSAVGSALYNMKLSWKRADGVKAYLAQKGIAPERMTTVGYGKTKLEVPELRPYRKESKGAKINRRVHFEIIIK
ncbi:MAG: OmpA family protein [Nitrospiraceae bacterium]|nr:OmpA family protein [Nitrospiraceae bacterium]